MLRVMKKRRLQEESSEGGDDNHMPPSMRIVSHIPITSSSKASVSSLSSAGSSLSSSQYHPFQALSRKEDDQTYDGEPPVAKGTVTLASEPPSSDSTATSQSSAEIGTSSPNAIALVDTPPISTVAISVVSNDVGARPKKLKRKRNETTWATKSPSEESDCHRRLLFTPMDMSSLSPLHIFVRQQIEVFEATQEDLKQPAPGRRVPIQPNQVGIRCIHCRNQVARQRKKRAVCYPSSVGRVYHSVSDMKFAHFPCEQMPEGLRLKFAELKDEAQALIKEPGTKRAGSSNASTAQYYHDNALLIGMMDGKGGIFAPQGLKTEKARAIDPPGHVYQPSSLVEVEPMKQPVATPAAPSPTIDVAPLPNMAPTETPMPPLTASSLSNISTAKGKDKGVSFLLSSETDEQFLAPIHCFVRRHIEVFAANEQDLATPAPGRKKPIALGQVGLRCIHCALLPVKDRVKRAVCFPPSVQGCYHAVSNMKFDHFKHCKGMPREAREEFLKLASSLSTSTGSAKRSSGAGTARPRVSNSTAQYYLDSALRMGLYDTSEGIRLKGRPEEGKSKQAKQQRGALLEGMEALIIAATDPQVRAAHERRQSLLPTQQV